MAGFVGIRTWPLAALGRVEGRPMLAGLKLCLARNAFFTGAPETRLRALLEASREAQDKVSEKLSNQVLAALYELLRGLHRAAPDSIEALAEHDAHHLYEGLLTCLMRLVFLLYAEDRDLLPSATDPSLKQLWENGYSIKTLYARLIVDEALNPDTMDERRGGWGQLLAVFRLIHGGHPHWVTGRGGKLFDPDAFPFLEGRDKGSARADAAVLSVSDGTILRILHGLMTVEGRSLSGEKIRERLSYRSLDVESIGSVYETVMGFTAGRATERMIALRDEKKLPNFVGLDALLKQKPNDRQKWLKERSIKLTAKQTKGVKDAAHVDSLIEAFGSLVDDRASPKATLIGPGAPYLQPTEERRRSGSHYTPRSLTEPIVRHALEPAFARLGDKASPEAVLSLKVLDPACGSGAFLVEACRQIGARLEQAWNIYGAEKPRIPPDEDEALHARRLVAQKCLYGVDRNPMAVDLARLSLWLATLARDHEFTFLDHALKAGDSLVGLTRAEISAAHWDASKLPLPLFRDMIGQAVERARVGREAIRNASDDVLMEAQAARYSRVLDESEPARIVGDAVIAAFFAGGKPKAREEERQKVESWIAGSLTPDWDRLRANASAFRAEHGWKPFHWEIEFPEVFARENAGFDAIFGNPPYLGSSSLGKTAGTSYTDFLRARHEGTGGKCDLSAFFLRSSSDSIRERGCVSLVTTNTIIQGDTRESGLYWLCKRGFTILWAQKREVWPGDASVHISKFTIQRTDSPPPTVSLNGISVANIDSFFSKLGVFDNPSLLATIPALSIGVKQRGDGFFLSHDELGQLVIDENSPWIKPIWGGDDIKNSPTTHPPRFSINLNSFVNETDLAKADKHIVETLRARVFKARSKLSGRLRSYWWIWEFDPTRKFHGSRLMLAIPETGPHLSIRMFEGDTIFSQTAYFSGCNSFAPFSVLQSRIHEIWARFFSSSMKDDLRYAPSDCFETFPFPLGYEADPTLEAAGQTYHDHRAALMVAANEGMTKTYNRFHDANERSEPIRRLRELHDDMDRAVLRAYGWHDLADELRPQFLTEDTEDDHTYQGRYFGPAEARDRVLARLLALNAARHAEEVEAGLAPATRARTSGEDDDEAQPGLDLE